ncbi:MAG: hypothetical protein JWO99_430 [Candidatus Saccharibacteria bacterium]|nr:hypothetical protein [Candidatus Saccharibacteria bacterium]
MAEKEQKEEIVEEKPTSTAVSKGGVVARKSASKWVLWVVIGIVVVYIILMAIGFAVFHAIADRNGNSTINGARTTQMMNRPRFSNERTYNVQQSSSDGLTTTTTNTTYTQTQGVVTAVNSDNIVVAGGGKTQTIKTSSSTTYAGDTKPAVNDTVVVVGTKDGDTITATQIAVYN